MTNVPAKAEPAENQKSAKSKSGLVATIAKVGPTLFVLAVMGGGWLAVHEINTGGGSEEEDSIVEEAAAPDSLTLPEGKVKAAKFESVPAQMQAVEHVHTIPGRIRYDETKHVDVKAPMDGILAEVLVTPGEHVESGQLLAVLRSPEIGQARAEVLKRQKEREIAQQMLQREMTLAKNLEQMSAMLDQGKSVDSIENAFRNRALGSYRQDILSAYAKMQLASELLSKIQPLANSGSVSGRTVRERQAERQMAETEFRTARDQATFAANQAKINAEAKVSEAERQLNLAWQSVETLLGYKGNKSTANLSNEEALSRLEIRAPFAGSVESRAFANNERVTRGDSLIVLANTDSLYVAASIRESDWSAVSLGQGTTVSVSVPALEDRIFEARIRYFGREVQADTNSVPLVATIENAEGLLRPGMFVRVTIPIGEAREALSVKPESVVQHENQEFVFVDESGGTFKRVDVATGQTSDEWVEVTKGLQPGQLVVTRGAFLLKSELLLQGEGE
ncbi:efflux RND transporter periplasmic adaptor subunit [Crateriforma conspicua]|uniref:Cobalt-zinc-cadmium resistance protein CzcB n=1 Tax=Crateriforma conspicua TaxID=2527996 RepID=A0A5C5Y9G6_9PLAN|nr:efflux RND transporter periplasmic adaptor subunit [Crateriforma conspicua]TWT71453.1 Cobalt-zinc-cadmium resistance protein CzcB [Crateriforma conspicua]